MKQNNNLLLIYILTVMIACAGFYGCSEGDNSEAKSMEQIQKDEGFPVVINKITVIPFTKGINFFGKFKGEKETSVGAMIGGRIEKINFHPGNKVRKNDVIIQFPEDSPASRYQQAKTGYELSKKTYERMKALLEKGEIAQAKFDGAETKYLVDKRNYETMMDMLKLDAPYDGTITDVMVHEGDNVKDKTLLFTIAKLNKMKIRIWLSDSERMQMKKGMKAIATVNGKSFTGKVSELSLSVNPMKQAFSTDLIFDNSKREILAGTTAEVKIITYENKNAILVPRNIIKNEGDKNYVFLVNGEVAKKQYVEITNENGINYEIGNGLKIGDSIIVKGAERLSDGIKIKIVK